MRKKTRRLSRLLRRSLLLAPLLALPHVGCTRSQYRLQADTEAYALLDEKVGHACAVDSPPLRIDISPQSRMFDPFDPDFEPMPQDDPCSHIYMHNVDGKRGYPMWHAAGDTDTAENPGWWHSLPLDERGVLVLDADLAVELAMVHSPDYQEQLETLYLSALDVSSERFQFDTQFFGGAQLFYRADGPDTPGGSDSELSLGTYSTRGNALQMSRRFATGADLLVRFANQVVWEFSGPDSQSATALLDFTLLQPLLRNAGRDRVLERLTLAERQLLANVRAFQRYRRSFYLNIVIGRNIESRPSRRGGVFGVGLGGFTGLGGGFAGLGGGGGGAGAGFAGGGVPQAGGFLGLLQNQLQIRNLEENVARLRENLLLLEDTLREQLQVIPADATTIPNQRLQIAQARQALITAQSQLVSQQSAQEASVDDFLADLGLPPYICTEIRDPWLDRLLLISEDLKSRRTGVTDLRENLGDINTRIVNLATVETDPNTGLPQRELAWSEELASQLRALRTALVPVAQLQNQLATVDVGSVREDLQNLSESLPNRTAQAERLMQEYQQQREQICQLLQVPTIDTEVLSATEAQRLDDTLRNDLSQLEQRLEAYGQQLHEVATAITALIAEYEESAPADTPESRAQLAQRIADQAVIATQDLLAAMSDDILALQLIQARARTESIVLPEIDLTPEQAFSVARVNRRDYANARASLVDSWRLIEFNADDLESELDIVLEGELRNAPGSNNPFDLSSDSGQIRAGIRWDAPLTRLQERNTYRQSLIEFQQARRSFYQFEDQLWQLLRGQLRQAKANQINFELQRYALRSAAEQISINEDIRSLREARGLASGPTAARDQISALGDLLSAQNNFLNIWVNYEVLRRGLDFDLGVMQLTPDGYWVDPGTLRYDTIGSSTQVLGCMCGMGGRCSACSPGVIAAPEPMEGDVVDPDLLRGPVRVMPPHGPATEPRPAIIHPQDEAPYPPRSSQRRGGETFQTISLRTSPQP